jgi:hypothetical protein
VTASQVRDLLGVVQREEAQIGVLISFQEPTKPMKAEAATAGFYASPWGKKYRKIQLRTVGVLLEGKAIVPTVQEADQQNIQKGPQSPEGRNTRGAGEL